MHIKRPDERKVDLDNMKHGEAVYRDAGGSKSFFGFPVSDTKERLPRDETRNCRPLCLKVARQGPLETPFEFRMGIVRFQRTVAR